MDRKWPCRVAGFGGILLSAALSLGVETSIAATPGGAVSEDTGAKPLWIERDRDAARRGDAEAQFRLGNAYHYGEGISGDHAEAAKWYRLAAEAGHARAQFKLGILYRSGEGVPRDDEEAAEWLEMAAQRGHRTAQLFLSALYRYGRGVPRDLVQAYLWAEQAAANGEMIGVSFMRFALAGMTDAERAETESRARFQLLPYK